VIPRLDLVASLALFLIEAKKNFLFSRIWPSLEVPDHRGSGAISPVPHLILE
jgi:hypothetical protein